MVFLHGYESHRIRKKKSLQKQIQEMKRWWNPLVFVCFLVKSTWHCDVCPQTVHQSFLEWQPTNLPRDYQLDIRQLCQLGNQVVQVVSHSLRWLCRCCPWKSQQRSTPPPPAVGYLGVSLGGRSFGTALRWGTWSMLGSFRPAGCTVENGFLVGDVREKTPKNLIVAVVFFGFSFYGKVERVKCLWMFFGEFFCLLKWM